MLIHTNEANFEKTINNKEVCLVDFFATWCGPCVMLGEELVAVAKENENIDVIKVDIDENPNLAEEYNIEVVPTMYVFKNGQPVQQIQGFLKRNELLKLINSYLN